MKSGSRLVSGERVAPRCRRRFGRPDQIPLEVVCAADTTYDLLDEGRYGAGGDGVSIGFDLKKLDLSLVEDHPGHTVRPTVVKVEYDQDKQDAEIRWIMSEAMEVFDRHIKTVAKNEDAAFYFTALFNYPMRDAFYWLKWEFKSPHYREEREWRIVVHPIGVGRKKTRVSNGYIVPYLEMPLPQTLGRPAHDLAIPHIVLGPRCPPLVIRGVRGLLSNLAFPKVERSRLALR